MDINKAELDGLECINLALLWAERGIRVLPVDSASKRPLIKAWQDQATSDPDTIELMWSAHPNARVGIATGDPGYDVVDFDVAGGKPGLEQYEKLLDQGIIEAGTFILVATPSGGRHCYFKGSDQRNRQNEKSIPGVDFRGQGGMVLAAGNPGYRIVVAGMVGPVSWDAIRTALAPPGTNETATPPRTYQAGASRPSVGTPEGERGRSPKLRNPGRPFEDQVGEESPLDWYTRTHDIDQMIMDAGWKFVTESGGRRHYRRPGKDHDISGNTAQMPDGRVVFFNFSSSVDLPTDTAMSAGMLYAHWEHGGNLAAAAKTIRQTQMPKREAPARPVPRPMPTVETAVVSTAQVETPDPIRGFWSRRPELREIWWQAQIADVSPWAVLGGCLAQVAARVGPHVSIPPPGGVGTPGSLNLLIAISGNSGTGKGQSRGVARGFFGTPNPPERKPGTGQGIAAIYTEQTKEGPVQTNDTAILNVSEITGLGAHADMQGSNLVATLLEVYMGEELGEHYANKEKRRPVGEGRYRLALTAGVQPGNSHIILDHAESGLPQRFVWMPAFWPDSILPESTLRPPAPGSELRKWRAWSTLLPGSLDDMQDATGWSPSDAGGGLQNPKKRDVEGAVPVKETVLVRFDPAVRREIEMDRKRRMNVLRKRMLDGEDDPGDPDSHLLLTRMKISAHLAFWLDNSIEVTPDVWDLAGHVVWISNDTRIRAARRLSEKAKDRVIARAMGQVATNRVLEAEAETKLTATHGKVSNRIETILADGEWHPTKDITQGIAGRDRKALRDGGESIQDVIAMLIQLGKVQTEAVQGGSHYRLVK